MKTLLIPLLAIASQAHAYARPPATRPTRQKPPATAPADQPATTRPARGEVPPATGSESMPDTPELIVDAGRGGSAGGDANGNPLVAPWPTRATSTLVGVVEGDLPIIISAPHGGTSAVPNVPKRTGAGVSQFETVTDTNTRQIAEKLIVSLERELGAKPYSVIARFDREYIDANREVRSAIESPNARVHYWAYHQPLQRFCDGITRRFGRGLLIDLHGQGMNANAIYRGTRTGQSVRHLTADFGNASVIGPNSVIGQMQQRGYSFLPVPTGNGLGTETSYNGGFITFAYGAMNQARIDSIQLELGGTYRGTQPTNLTTAQETARQQKTADDLAASIAVFVRTYYPNAVEVQTNND